MGATGTIIRCRATVPPTAPQVVAALTDAGIELHWNRIAGTGIYYNIYWDPTVDGLGSTLLGTTADTSFTDPAGTTFPASPRYYMVRTVRP